MISRRTDIWNPEGPAARGRRAALVACALLAASCASVETAGRSIQYRLAGTDTALRKNLESGLQHLKAGNHAAAIASLNTAIWDLERIENAWFRMKELAEAYRGLADAYTGLRRAAWGEEHRTLAGILAGRAEKGSVEVLPERALAQGKSAYATARFREAAPVLNESLADLEGVGPRDARVKALEEARCYLTFTFVALDQRDRAVEEIRRLWALDSTVAFCRQLAPPSIRTLIDRVRTESKVQ